MTTQEAEQILDKSAWFQTINKRLEDPNEMDPLAVLQDIPRLATPREMQAWRLVARVIFDAVKRDMGAGA